MGEGDPSQCRLLAGPAAIAAQLLLAAFALASLLYKRHIERPQRPLNIWGLDVSKQAISMLAAHACGMLIALIAHNSVDAGASSECGWYAVAFVFDTTVGLLLTICLHKAALRAAHWYGERHSQRYGQPLQLETADGGGGTTVAAAAGEPWFAALQLCGNYGDPPSYRRWSIQLGEWVGCVVLARVLCGTLVLLLGQLLVHVAQGLDGLFTGHPTAELYVVMICCPLLLNICQALIQDLVLKWRARGGAKETSMAATGAAEREASLLGAATERSAPV